jgi:hypothetical protein
LKRRVARRQTIIFRPSKIKKSSQERASLGNKAGENLESPLTNPCGLPVGISTWQGLGFDADRFQSLVWRVAAVLTADFARCCYIKRGRVMFFFAVVDPGPP